MKTDGLLCENPRDGELEFEQDPQEPAEPESPEIDIQWTRPQVEAHGDVNALYHAYASERDAADGSIASQLRIQTAKDALLVDIYNYTLRLALGDLFTLHKFGFEAADAAQGFLSHIISSYTRGANKGIVRLDTFRGESKFSTWIAEAFFNRQTDKIRASIVDAEVSLDEAKSYEEQSGASAYCATPTETEDGDRSQGRTLYSPAVVEAAADRIINAVVLQKFVNRLSEHEQSALRLMAEGYAIREIVEKLKLRKADLHKLYHLREKLRKQYEDIFDTAGVVVHTCPLTLSVPPTEILVGYIPDQDGTFHKMKLTCRCRKSVTLSEAVALVERGEAHHVNIINKKGDTVIDQTRVWSPQLVQIHRKAIPAATGNRGAQRDLELGNEMTLETRRQMTVEVPADEYDRVKKEQSGRSCVRYTPTGKDDNDKPLPWKPPAPHFKRYHIVSFVSGGCHLSNGKDKCRRGVVSRGVYPDGSQIRSCTCGSLMVVKAPDSNVIVVKGDESFLPPFQAVPTQSIPEARV